MTRLRRVAALLVAGIVLAGLPAAGGGARPETASRELLVTARSDAVDAVRHTAAEAAAEVAVLGPESATVVLTVASVGHDGAELERDLRGLDGVLAVERDALRSFATAPAGRGRADKTPDDPGYGLQWPHELTGIGSAWERTTGDREVVVAVLDSGIAGDHRDLADNVSEQIDVADGSAEVVTPRGGTPVDGDTCGVGHGTAVAGVLGAVGDDGLGLAGAAWKVSLLDVALVSTRHEDGRCDAIPDSAIVAGMDAAVRAGADVVNLSLGAPGDACPRALQTAIDWVLDSGAVVVAAAGNEGSRQPHVPAACDGVLAVGAVARDGEVASYSNRHPGIDLVAPGGQPDVDGGRIPTTLRAGSPCSDPLLDGRWCGVAGTSYAAPYVAGTAALLESVAPDLTPSDVEHVLETTARRDSEAREDSTGWGLVDPGAALEAAEEHRPAPQPAAADEPSFPVGVPRVAAGSPQTETIAQAAAVSRAVFADDAADHAVVARADDFADALGGSALAGSDGPVLFTGRQGALAPETAAELARVLEPGAPVYLLGGEAALPLGLEADVTELGLAPMRLSGAAREQTAAAVAAALAGRAGVPDEVLVATRGGWPDAVAAGVLGARSGLPILLTGAESLHPATAQLLADWRPETVTVIGGEAVVSAAAAQDAADAAGGAALRRLAGAERFATAAAVARATADRGGAASVVVVNLRRGDAFAHVLSATPLAADRGAVLAAVEDDGGTTLPAATRALLLELQGRRAVVAGGTDLVNGAVADEVERLLGG